MVGSGFCGDQTTCRMSSCSSAEESFVSGCKMKVVEPAAHLLVTLLTLERLHQHFIMEYRRLRHSFLHKSDQLKQSIFM